MTSRDLLKECTVNMILPKEKRKHLTKSNKKSFVLFHLFVYLYDTVSCGQGWLQTHHAANDNPELEISHLYFPSIGI